MCIFVGYSHNLLENRCIIDIDHVICLLPCSQNPVRVSINLLNFYCIKHSTLLLTRICLVSHLLTILPRCDVNVVNKRYLSC